MSALLEEEWPPPPTACPSWCVIDHDADEERERLYHSSEEMPSTFLLDNGTYAPWHIYVSYDQDGVRASWNIDVDNGLDATATRDLGHALIAMADHMDALTSAEVSR